MIFIIISGSEAKDAYDMLEQRLERVIGILEDADISVVHNIESGKYEVDISDSGVSISSGKADNQTDSTTQVVINTGGGAHVSKSIHAKSFVGRDQVTVVQTSGKGDVISAQVSKSSSNVAVGKRINLISIKSG